MKLLNGSELSGYIKERQAKQVRNLQQQWQVSPRLAIIVTNPMPVVATYVRLKQQYGDDIGVAVDVHTIPQEAALSTIDTLNSDPTVHGIIVQLPLKDPTQTDEIVNAVEPEKDVDALGKGAVLDPATPMAINWLLAGYNIEIKHKKIVIVGAGRLVGAPLARMWRNSGCDVTVVTKETADIRSVLFTADIIVSAAGVPGLITSDMVQIGAVVVDAGTASEDGKIKGDVSPDLRERSDLTITPEKGGVGPLTVTALFDNVIRAARMSAIK
ncbi:MAG TPA: bifunctional 5,10-methylenetetrahydrofolate dehydrogenase/5,10-methenyltetrahydrofolate cyclohydrolase [Verrucomicrobiae bacterium]|nr:bifunctional 5,10-methylenetetrahydrofolate dehydrogenase/5,10-methenyltetrahydrofolate cyclohydrolase [Verrucomicrobiae bacterium]